MRPPLPKAVERWWIAIIFLTLLSIRLQSAETSYWVWGKRPALSEETRSLLAQQGVRKIYRQVATVDGVQVPDSLLTTASELKQDAPAFTVVPVVRVETREIPKLDYFQKLRARFPALQGDALQLDFDCPDRLLGDYATLLRELKEFWPKLSITALAHWAELKDFGAVARSVEEVCPMFYDLQRDPTGVDAKNPPPSLLDRRQMERLLGAWKNCPTPWRAGLPAFTRVTVYDTTGLSRGQVFGWHWDEIAFNRHLRSERSGGGGVQLFRVAAKTSVAGRALSPGELLATRQTELTELAECRALAVGVGAKGVVLFRLPDPDDDSTWSLRSLAAASSGKPELRARLESGAVTFENRGDSDLAPRLHGPRHDRDRGHALEIDAPASVFREAEPGQFFRVGAHVSPEKDPQAASVLAATRVTFWFSHLKAGETLRSGLFQLAPHADPKVLRWRIGDGPWQPLVP